jgi:serine/threonine protein kinase
VTEPVIFNNRYQILAKLGEGGLAEVYRAQDVALGRLVAVKALRREYVVDPAFLVRFHPALPIPISWLCMTLVKTWAGRTL